jgi:polyisoprenyl-teichoic acid--peptidoglycan teichoic acid transferase
MSMANQLRSERKKKKKRWWKRIGVFFLFVLIAGGAYAYSVYHSLNKAIETIHEPIERVKSGKREEELKLEKKEPFSVLLLGVDERKNDSGRSDTMIVLTVNPNEPSIQMLSIPRDTRTLIVGKGFEDKINHAYAFGGVDMAIATVENFLDIPIDYYIQVNMEGFKDIVDAVDGVTVQNDFSFTYGEVHFPKGEITLNGEEALLYSRMRKQDPRGDFGRQDRQQKIIQGVIKKGASISSLWNYGDIFNAISKNVKTNMSFEEMVQIQKNYREAGKHIERHQISGSGKTINSVWYLIVPDEERERIQTLLKDHLKLK